MPTPKHLHNIMLALTPLFFFIIIYLVGSIVAGDFYKVPISVAFLFTAVVAIAVSKGGMTKRIKVFSRGAANTNMMLMIWIFILAGAFANSAKEMGSINDMVHLTLSLVPSDSIYAGIFIAAILISLSIGKSVGTIVALMPIGVGIAEVLHGSVAFVSAIIIGGAFFGDNLSFISDTTVCATQSQGCRMKDKFLTNIRIALPAALILLIGYAIYGINAAGASGEHDYTLLKVIPYLVVLITALLGVNVLIVLFTGIILTGAVGIIYGDYDLFSWFSAVSNGILGMSELIIITMLAGGVLELTRANGGIRFLMQHILRHVHSPRSAEFSIAALVATVDLCTANNTVAIITTAGIAKDISTRFNLDPRRVASILDIFSCIIQGIIPYGAQLLMGAALAGIAPTEILPYLYYPYALAVCAVLAILLHKHHTADNSSLH